MNQEEFKKTRNTSLIKLALLIVVTIFSIGILYLDYIEVGIPKHLSFITSVGAFILLYDLFGEAFFAFGKYGDEVKRRQIEKWKKDNLNKPKTVTMPTIGKVLFVITVLIFIYAIYLNITA